MPWRGPEQPGEYPTLGYTAIDWIEDTLRFTDGAKIGQPVRLYPEQQRHFLQRYRLDPDAAGEAGNDAYLRSGSMLVRGQKWGKDPLLAMDLLFQAFGPCCFAGWDGSGEPVGAEHPSPWIAIAALNDKQTDNTWLPFKAMVESSELYDLPGVEVTKEQVTLPCGNPAEPLTTTAFGRLGGRFTAVGLTENGLMTDTVQTGAGAGKRSALEFARTIIRSVNGLGGMWMAATNTWDPTERSHAQRVYEAWQRTNSPTIFVDAKISRGKVDLTEDEQLRAELLYLYGDSAKENGGHVSVRRLMNDCRDTEVHGESQLRRFYLSEILAGEAVLCDPTVWAGLTAVDDPLQPGDAITIGFDGSRARDCTVLTACRIRDGRIFHLHTWYPECMCGPDAGHDPAKCPWPRIDRVAVDRAVTAIRAAYLVWYQYGDPYKWQDYHDKWRATFAELTPAERRAGLPRQRIVEVPTNVETRMDLILERFTTARDAGDFSHSGDPVLTQHVRDSVITKGRRKPAKPRVDGQGVVLEHYLKVERKAPGVLIDAAISMLLALEARGQAVEDGALKPRPDAIAPVAYTDDPAELARDRQVRHESGDDIGPDWNDVRF